MNQKIDLLIVDDEPEFLSDITRDYQSAFNVATASSGDSALKTLRENPQRWFVVLSDERMPGMSGRELFRRILDEKISHLGRILVTGFGDNDMAVSAFNDGTLDNYIEKPLTATKIDLLRSYIESAALDGVYRLRMERAAHWTTASDKEATLGRLVDGVLDHFRNAFHSLIQREDIARHMAAFIRRDLDAGTDVHPHLDKLDEVLESNRTIFAGVQDTFRSTGDLSTMRMNDKEGYPIGSILRSAVSSVRTLAIGRHVNVRLKVTAKSDFMKCVPSDFFYVFTNLLLPAVAAGSADSQVMIDLTEESSRLVVTISHGTAGERSANPSPAAGTEPETGSSDQRIQSILDKYGGTMKREGSADALKVTISVPKTA